MRFTIILVALAVAAGGVGLYMTSHEPEAPQPDGNALERADAPPAGPAASGQSAEPEAQAAGDTLPPGPAGTSQAVESAPGTQVEPEPPIAAVPDTAEPESPTVAEVAEPEPESPAATVAEVTEPEPESPAAPVADVAEPGLESPAATAADVAEPAPESPPATIAEVSEPEPESPPATIADVTEPEPESPAATVADVVEPATESPPAPVAATVEPATVGSADNAPEAVGPPDPGSSGDASADAAEPPAGTETGVVAPVADAAVSEATAADGAETEVASLPDAQDAAGALPASPPDSQPEPSVLGFAPPAFDAVRLSGRGNLVIAGTAPAGSTVSVVDGGTSLGQVHADEGGQWVFIANGPLDPGSYEIELVADPADGREGPVPSDEVLVVVVPENARDIAGTDARDVPERAGPLAMLVQRDGLGPSVVIQAPQAPGVETPPAAPVAEPVPLAAAPVETQEPPPPSVAEPEQVAGLPPQPAEPPAGPTGPPSDPSAAVAPAGEPEQAQPAGEGAPAGPAALAEATPEATEAPVAPAGPEVGPAAEPQPVPRPEPQAVAAAVPEPPPPPDVVVSVVDYDDRGRFFVSGTAEPGATLRLYLDNRVILEDWATADGRFVLAPQQSVPPGLYRLRVDHLDAAGGVVARAEIPFQRDAPVDPPPGHRRITVQPGNNLWTIARGTYGDGLQYTVIFQANEDQIRDPDLIYPGQVFVLPAVPDSVPLGMPQ